MENSELKSRPLAAVKNTKVARPEYDALMEGLDHIVAGSLRNRLNVVGAKIMSENQCIKMQARQTKPKSVEK
jgi:hypothetical protein